MIEVYPNVLATGLRSGTVVAPPSKSHAHRLLIANFLAGVRDNLAPVAGDSADLAATRRCLAALAGPASDPMLDCGESGSTLRFLSPVSAALGKRPLYVRRGRLANRPFIEYPTLESGLYELRGDVSSQFVTGLLFALPLLAGDSRIRFLSPLESRGYVEMTRRVLVGAGVNVVEEPDGYAVPGGQAYRPQATPVEGDWSGAAFWLAMDALGSSVSVEGLDTDSAQPDRAVGHLLAALAAGGSSGRVELDMAQCPDLFPALAVAAAGTACETRFTGVRRLRLKECDRLEAMAEVLAGFGVPVQATDEAFVVQGTSKPLRGGRFRSFGDHRIAMAVAVGATRASGEVRLDDVACVAKSYPGFFCDFAATLPDMV